MKVSIVITCFNREKRIARAIRSAISQRFSRESMEVIVVDDGSTDASQAIIADFGEDVVPILCDENQGLPAARNAGIRKARGRFVIHLDSDDYMHEETISVLYLHLAYNPEWGAVACDYLLVDDQERHLRRAYADEEPIACGILFRKEALVDIGLYDREMRLLEDRELRHRFEKRYTIGFCRVPLYRYVRHDGNLTNNVDAVNHYEQVLSEKTR